MKVSRLIVVWACALLVASPAVAEEPFQAFLRGLQDRHYGEQSLDYIESIKDRPDLPVEIKQALDLERSRSLKIAAGEAYDATARDARLAQSKELLDKFLKDSPDHPAVGDALIAFADESLQIGQMSLGQARATRDPAEKKTATEAARAKLTEAKNQFNVAVARLKTRLDQFPNPAEGKPLKPKEFEARTDAEFAWLEARFKAAQVDYLLAQSYDEKDANRKTLLTDAGKVFDAIFQEYRGKRVAFLGHMWHGKTLEELGDTQLAFDVYDEVLVLDTKDGTREPPVSDAPLYGQAELFRLRLVAKTKDPTEVIQEGEEWMKEHRTWLKTSVYQGIALEVAKAALAFAERATSPAEKKKLQREVLTALNAIGKVETEYKPEALLMRRDVLEKLGAEEGGMSGDESLVIGRDAAAAKDWPEAQKLYEEAIAAAIKNENDKLAAQALGELNKVRYVMAVEKFEAREMKDALDLVGKIAATPEDPLAEPASGLAIAAALELYKVAAGAAAAAGAPPTAAEDAAKALARLEKIANFPVGKWPDSATADEGRMALAQAHVLKVEPDKALTMLEGIRTESRHYPAAMNLSARILWKRYLDVKKSPDAATQQEVLTQTRDQARGKLQTSLDLQVKNRPAGETKLSQTHFDTQLLLAEVLNEQQQPAAAAPLFQGLVADLQKNKPAAIDNTVLRTFIGAVRSHIAAAQVAQAGEAALALIALSDDTPQLNSVLVDFAKLLTLEMKKAEAAAIEAEGAGDATKAAEAKTQVDNIKLALGQVAAQLATRQQLNVQQLVFLGDTCALVVQNDKAREVYQRVTEMIEKDPAAKATAGGAITRVRAQLISLLRSEAKYEDANKQVDGLIAEHPTALEPLMEKGRILQSWALRDASKYDECVAHWTKVRLMLGRMRTKPPEYYEVLYNAASALVVQARKESDPEKAQQAEQMLKSTLVLNSTLGGAPDMVAKYQQLAKQAGALKSLVKPASVPKKKATTSSTATTSTKPAAAPATTAKKTATTPSTTAKKKTTTTTPAAPKKKPATKTTAAVKP